jgi:hypothetical protein
MKVIRNKTFPETPPLPVSVLNPSLGGCSCSTTAATTITDQQRSSPLLPDFLNPADKASSTIQAIHPMFNSQLLTPRQTVGQYISINSDANRLTLAVAILGVSNSSQAKFSQPLHQPQQQFLDLLTTSLPALNFGWAKQAQSHLAVSFIDGSDSQHLLQEANDDLMQLPSPDNEATWSKCIQDDTTDANRNVNVEDCEIDMNTLTATREAAIRSGGRILAC